MFNTLYDQTWMEDFSPQYSTYQELESTGRLNLIHTERLRLAILDHYAFYRQMEAEFDQALVVQAYRDAIASEAIRREVVKTA